MTKKSRFIGLLNQPSHLTLTFIHHESVGQREYSMLVSVLQGLYQFLAKLLRVKK